MTYYAIQTKQTEHAGWKPHWEDYDKDVIRQLYKEMVTARRYYAVRLLTTTPPPESVTRSVLEYWESNQ